MSKQTFWGVQVKSRGEWEWFVDGDGDCIFRSTSLKACNDPDPRKRIVNTSGPFRVRKFVLPEIDDE